MAQAKRKSSNGGNGSKTSLKYVVEGHTDSTGSDAKNRELSFKRALSVRDYA